MSKSKTVKQIQSARVEALSSEDEYSFHVHKFKGSNKQPKTKVRMLDTGIEMLVDTGTTVNITDETTLAKLLEHPSIHHTATKIYAYGSKKPINLVGSFRTEMLSVAHQTTITTEIYVAKGECTNHFSATRLQWT